MLGKKRSFSGSSSYRHVEPFIRNGRDICIVSPYIDPYYAGFLARISRGRRIRIISSSIGKEAAALLGKRLSVGRFAAFLLIAVAELYVGIALSVYTYSLAAVLITLSAGYILSNVRNRGIELLIPKEFIHAKMYITEKGAITGSANLTYRGMHKNVEMIEITDDEEEIKGMRDTFYKMWREYS